LFQFLEGLSDRAAAFNLRYRIDWKIALGLELGDAYERICGKIDNWKNSSQKERWLASALVEIEPNLRRVKGYEHLAALRVAIKKELAI
jgi:hypothetical protein